MGKKRFCAGFAICSVGKTGSPRYGVDFFVVCPLLGYPASSVSFDLPRQIGKRRLCERLRDFLIRCHNHFPWILFHSQFLLRKVVAGKKVSRGNETPRGITLFITFQKQGSTCVLIFALILFLEGRIITVSNTFILFYFKFYFHSIKFTFEIICLISTSK